VSLSAYFQKRDDEDDDEAAEGILVDAAVTDDEDEDVVVIADTAPKAEVGTDMLVDHRIGAFVDGRSVVS